VKQTLGFNFWVMFMVSKRNSGGFTLIELSIVIVIIGLIVAGVVGGQTLVKQAKLRSIISEQQQVKLAINAFKLEYDAVPGDFNNANAYWATANNGNGNKRMETIVVNTDVEMYAAWEHIALAVLHPGSFTPDGTLAVVAADVGVKVPASKYTGAVMTMVFDDATSDATAGDGLTAGRNADVNVVMFGGVQATGTGLANGTIFEVKDIQGLDDKVDDGGPVTGTVLAVGVSDDAATDCIDDGGDNTANTDDDVYNLDTTDPSPCAVAFTL
jgi:prepilin-type N-terminal cleavage/methylation domain-containing protein